MSTDTPVQEPVVEVAKPVKFFNVKNPGIKVLVAQDKDSLTPGPNAMLANDKYVSFVGGWCESADPEVIAKLKSPEMRAKGVRCMDIPEDVLEFGTAADKEKALEDIVERRVQQRLEEERAQALHAQASPFLVSDAEAAESVAPAEE